MRTCESKHESGHELMWLPRARKRPWMKTVKGDSYLQDLVKGVGQE